MAARLNPFRPSFGITPPVVAGRDITTSLFGDALDAGPGAPGRATIYTGARGVGKTVMLNEAEAGARSRGWVVISETAATGLINRLVEDQFPSVSELLDISPSKSHLTGVTLPMGMGGATRSVAPPKAPKSVRQWINRITDHLDQRGTGLLITVDEVHGGDRGDLRELGVAVQHAFREERPLAFAAAGLPSAVNDLLSDDVLTFLRRAERIHLGTVSFPDTADALAIPILNAGRHIDRALLHRSAKATGGYPFLIQLIGYHLWNSTTADEFTEDNVTVAIEAARARIGAQVYESALRDISVTDRELLFAMIEDEGRPSKMADIASRMNRSANFVSQYRIRLLGTDLIREHGHGYVTFAMPYFLEYLKENESRWR